MAKILVVDDEKETADLLRIVLEKDAHAVNVANSGAECLAFLGQQVPELILLDVAMPEMDGYTLVTHMSSDGAMRDIPILIVSGRDSLKDTFQMFTNVVGFVSKPFDVKELRARVGQILAQRGLS